jgi:hypothetical protein
MRNRNTWIGPLSVPGAWQRALAEGIDPKQRLPTEVGGRDPIAMTQAPNHTHGRNMQ